jgi:hypothetical protein
VSGKRGGGRVVEGEDVMCSREIEAIPALASGQQRKCVENTEEVIVSVGYQ